MTLEIFKFSLELFQTSVECRLLQSDFFSKCLISKSDLLVNEKRDVSLAKSNLSSETKLKYVHTFGLGTELHSLEGNFVQTKCDVSHAEIGSNFHDP